MESVATASRIQSCATGSVESEFSAGHPGLRCHTEPLLTALITRRTGTTGMATHSPS